MTNITNGTTLTRASHQWATRPDDQRFLTLDDLRDSVAARKEQSWTVAPSMRTLRCFVGEGDDLRVSLYDPNHAEQRDLAPSNWSFGQLSQYAKAPANYLKTLPAQLAAINLQWGLEMNSLRDDGLILAQTNGDNTLRAITSTSYGRIWDLEVVDAVIRANRNGEWVIPAASYTAKQPKRATTLYASDRDVFIFLVDDKHEVQVGDDVLFRGFMVWNSEVGSATFGLSTFLYRYVCDNRMVWGATNIQELRIRHTGGAPDRFAVEGRALLDRYANESTEATVRAIEKAKDMDVPGLKASSEKSERDQVSDWLKGRGFTQAEARGAVDSAIAEEGSVRSVWDVINGVTSFARTIAHTDTRVGLERRAGQIMDQVVVRN